MTLLLRSSQTLGSQAADAMYYPLYDWPLQTQTEPGSLAEMLCSALP